MTDRQTDRRTDGWTDILVVNAALISYVARSKTDCLGDFLVARPKSWTVFGDDHQSGPVTDISGVPFHSPTTRQCQLVWRDARVAPMTA